jgi:hypothetical protein
VTLRRVLVELTMTEQRYRAVLEVQADVPVTEVAERFGVSLSRPGPKSPGWAAGVGTGNSAKVLVTGVEPPDLSAVFSRYHRALSGLTLIPVSREFGPSPWALPGGWRMS